YHLRRTGRRTPRRRLPVARRRPLRAGRQHGCIPARPAGGDREDAARRRGSMSRRVRLSLFFATAPIFAAVVVRGLTGLPDFGHYRHAYGEILARAAPVERH